jgi:hypothetical protein
MYTFTEIIIAPDNSAIAQFYRNQITAPDVPPPYFKCFGRAWIVNARPTNISASDVGNKQWS